MFISSEYFSVLSGGRNRYGQQAIIDQLLVNDHSPGSSISVCKRMDPRKMDMTDCNFLKNLLYFYLLYLQQGQPDLKKERKKFFLREIQLGWREIQPWW